MDKMAHDVNDQMLTEEFARGLRVVGKGHRIVSRDLEFMRDLGFPIGDDPKNRGLKDGYYEGPLGLFGEIT